MMRHTDRSIRVGGTWFAIASFLMIVVLVLHGPISPDLGEQMTRVSDMVLKWSVAHWIAAAGLSLHAVAGLVILTSQSRLTGGWWTTTAWAVIPIAALWTLTTAVAEATVVSDAARYGNREVFDVWWAFAQGKANGFAFLALAVAVIAGNEAQSAERAVPVWSAWIAIIASVVSFTGWALGMWFGMGLGGVIWVISSILMSAWSVWFGVALARSPVSAMPGVEER
jgi:hypothetical protein